VERDRIRVGTDRPYAAIHEFGFDGNVNVRPHVRTLKSGTTFPVRAHMRHMRMPKRPHRAPAVRDASRPIALLFAGQVEKAIRESKRKGDRLKGSQIAAGFTPGARRTK
jgi:phage gpG-like protein